MAAVKVKKRPERFRLIVGDGTAGGAFMPADALTSARLRAKGYRRGDTLLAEFRKDNNPKFNGLMHKFGELCAENLEAFEGMAPHSVLKRLQIEANIGCDEIAVVFPGIGPCSYRIPQSLSFESMDDGERHEVFKSFCRYVAKTYWSGLTPAQIETMAGAMVEAA